MGRIRNMDKTRVNRSLASFGVTALLAMTAFTAQVASGAGVTGIDDTGNYRSEVQACMNGQTQEDRDTCLKEARNAHADKQRGLLDNSGASYEQNAKARCNVQKGEDRAACEARVLGFGEASGSVEGGGIIREVETVVVPADHQGTVTIEPKTSDPVVLVPAQR